MNQQDVEDQQALAANDIDPDADNYNLEDLFTPREGTPKEIVDAYFNQAVYGPEAVLLAGFRSEEIAMVRIILDSYGGQAVKVVPCTPALLHAPVSKALVAPEPNWNQPAPQAWLSGSTWGSQRTILFSGLNPAAQSAVVELLEESGLPPICIAAVDADNADSVLGEVLVRAVKGQRSRKAGAQDAEWRGRVTDELPNIEELLKDRMPDILQEVEGGEQSAEAAFAEAGSAASSKDRSGSSAAPECMLTNGFKVLASPTAVPSQSRETRASTQSAASTVASTESLPSISAGQSREFQADSQMSSTSDSYSPEEFRVLEPDARNLSSTDDSSQSRETRASTQSAASTMASTESIPGTSAGQSRDFQAVSSSASVPEASGIQDQPAAGQSPASRPVAGASQSREPQAATQSAVSTAASSESIPDSSAGQSRDFQPDTNAFNSNPGPHQQQSPGASMPATARQSRPAGFPEPPPLPSSFKLRPGPSPPQQPRANGASSRPLSATPAGIHADVNGRSTSGRGNEFPATIGPAPGSSPPWIGKTAGGSSSTSRMRDYAASIGAGPGSSPYERRSGPGKKTAARPFPNASGAGEDSVGADSLSSSSSRGVVPISGMPGDKATDPLPGNTDNSLSSAGESSSSMLGGHARSRQPSQLKSRRAGSNVWDPNEPDFVGFPDHDRVVRGGPDNPLPTIRPPAPTAEPRSPGFQPDVVQSSGTGSAAAPADMSWGTNPWQNAVRMAEGGAGSRVPRQPREGRRAGNSQRNPWAKTIKQQREKEWLRAGSTRPELGPKSVSGGSSAAGQQQPDQKAAEPPLSAESMRQEARGPARELIAAAMACGLTSDELKTMVDEAVADKAKGKSIDPLAAVKAFEPEHDDVPDPRAAERAVTQQQIFGQMDVQRPGQNEPIRATVMQGTLE
ncbi:hypothetical protein WJX84_002200 [Apatococcus fuscideae]|uniref:Uncharacterized protein n=1 Tax=Apatococcus fuscideae TaxID=2026836 RepID=A0AAW1S752_9CHLO